MDLFMVNLRLFILSLYALKYQFNYTFFTKLPLATILVA